MKKVTILTNKKGTVVINSEATTLGALKQEMDAAGVDYIGMSIFEGISRTELLDDNSILPSNLPYKGTTTDDLVILLSVKDKKITSGQISRGELYAKIREYNLQEEVEKTMHRNFTLVSNLDLLRIITAYTQKLSNEKVKSEANKPSSAMSEKSKADVCLSLINIIFAMLHDVEIADDDDIELLNAVQKDFGKLEFTDLKKEEKVESPYSSEELSNIVESLVH